MAKKKIVVLGGGAGALSAVFGLTENPNWQNEYDITVYQLGWRLGGKGASGRDLSPGGNARIEEHGLHVWGGFYENAFRVMTACYHDMNRPQQAPLAQLFFEAFQPLSNITWQEQVNGNWVTWNNTFPQNLNGPLPGDGTPFPSTWQSLKRLMEWIAETLIHSIGQDLSSSSTPPVPPSAKPGWLNQLLSTVEATTSEVGRTLRSLMPSIPHVSDLHDLLSLAHSLPEDPKQHRAADHHGLLLLIESWFNQFKTWIKDRIETNDFLRRLAILIELGVAHTRGLIECGVLTKGFDAIDNQEWVAWLRKYGLSDLGANSAIVRGAYDFIFAYEDGDPAKPSVAAGTMVRCLMRLLMWYKAAIFFRMGAGMGDTVFAPLFFYLMKRGVRFEFFSAVRSLQPSDDGKNVAKIVIGTQATLKDPATGYQPLVDVKGLPSWPNNALFDQLVEGSELQSKNINLESYWADWPDVSTNVLQAGSDFDQIILGIPVASLRTIAAPLVAVNPAWQSMLESLKTVQTQALQLWLTADNETLGWTFGPTCLTAYAHPLETWADMSQVLPREDWPGTPPQAISYFCGPLPGSDDAIPPPTDYGYPDEVQQVAEQNARSWYEANTGIIWPLGADPTQPSSLDWKYLCSPPNVSGPQRLDSQFIRANIDPNERYVLSLPGTTSKRLAPGKSGFQNLYLAGDWVLNGLNFGCIESAVTGGLLASQAICGYPQSIPGTNDE